MVRTQCTITCSNVCYYSNGSWSIITKIEWFAGPLIESVLKNFPNLEHLVCCGNGLDTLKGIEVCTQLQHLNCGNNKLETLKGIENLGITSLYCGYNHLRTLDYIPVQHLRTLFCGKSNLGSLVGLRACSQLRKLGCYDCELKSLAGIESLSMLEYLDCDNNELESISSIASCTNLETLFCRSSELTTLAGIEACINLEHLYCQYNRLTTLTGIETCTRLQTIACHNNDLTDLNCIAYLRNLINIEYRNNALDIQTPQVQRILNRIQANSSSSIYADGQNVHDTHVQKSVCDSVRNLLSDDRPEFSIESMIESGLDTRAVQLLLEYCADGSVHSIHNLTYAELLSYVWARVCGSEHKTELLTILAEQVCDSECKCFTGRFNRTLSVLVGFYPDITITISDSSRISAIILAIGAKINDPVMHRQTAQTELISAGYTLEEIKPWLEAIADLEVEQD